MNRQEVQLFRILFVVAAIWNLVGAGFGYFNPDYTFYQFFGRELSDPLIYAIYKGAWGTTLVYFFGYMIVAYNPIKHSGIVIVGGIGKVGFAMALLRLFLSELAQPVVFIVIIGDFIFFILFLWYFWRLHQNREEVI